MIKKVGFENIRVFKDLAEFELRPITVLTGPNNTGKSTLQKMLMLLASGLKKEDKSILLSKLEFKDDLLNIVGDFQNNRTYLSEKNEIEFTFEFEDKIFGNIETTLVYEPDDKKNGELTEILFKSNGEDLFSYNLVRNKGKIKNNIYGDYWVMDPSIYSKYIPILYGRLATLKEIGRKQKVLEEIAYKLENNKNAIEDFTEAESEVYEYYKDLGIVAGCKEALELQDEMRHEPRWCVYDFNTKYFYHPNTYANEVYQFFKTTKGEFLLNSEILDEIGDDFDVFINNEENKHNKLKNTLISKGIYNSDIFANKYREFEVLILFYNFKDLVYPTTFEYDIDHGISIDEIFKKNVKINPIIKLHENPQVVLQNKSNVIIEIFKECDFIEPIKNVMISNELLNDLVKGDQLSNKKTKQVASNVTNFFMYPAITFNKKLLDFLNSIEISNQDIIKKYYTLDDANLSNSPFIKFAKHQSQEKTEFVNKWLLKLEIAKELRVKEIKIDNQVIGYYYALLINDIEIPLVDHGMGINKMVLLLLKIVTADSYTYFLLEEPEINLHPALQSKLANLFVNAHIKFKAKFIIETHSEYLIRKMQYLTAKKDLQIDDSIIYYFNEDKFINAKEPKIKSIYISDTGGLSDSFGLGFFDEATKLQFDLIRLQKQQFN